MKNMLTVEAFAEWCEKQPADGEYDYAEPQDCPIAQFLRANGFPEARVNSVDWRESDRTYDYHNLPRGFDDAVIESPRTFGSLAQRLRSIPS